MTTPTIPSKPDNDDPATFFLREIERILGKQEKPEDQAFLVDLSTTLDFKGWGPADYACAAQLFLDYRVCLNKLGERAQTIGYRVSISASLFSRPQDHLRWGTMMGFLLRIKDLSTPSWWSSKVFA